MSSITVLTTTYRRSQYLRRYLETLVRAQGFSDVRVLILINGDDVETELLLDEYMRKYHNIRFIKSERHTTRGKARNILMGQSRESNIFYFLDDDCRVTEDVFYVLASVAQAYPDIDCFGGPNLTPPDADTFARAQGYALGSFFGAFWVRDRYRIYGNPRLADDRSLILCNLAVRRKAFERADLSFNEAVVCAEENLLIQILISMGHKCMHVPHLAVFHERRNSVSGFWGQMFIYGWGRCQVLKKGQARNWLVYMFFGLTLTALGLFFLRYCGAALMAYMALCVANAAGIVWRVKDWKAFWTILYIFPLIHSGYILGFIQGLLPDGKSCRSVLIMNRFYIEVHGCSRRLLDGERIKNYMLANGGVRVSNPAEAQHLIIVTCALTQSMTEECFFKIKTLCRFKGRLIVYGCLPAMFPERIRDIFNGRVLATKDILEMDDLFPEFAVKFNMIPDANQTLEAFGNALGLKMSLKSFFTLQANRIRKAGRILINEYASYWPVSMRLRKGISDLYRMGQPVIEGVFGGIGFDPGIGSIRVSEGCEGHCSYCGIRKAIGRTRSKPIKVIQDELRCLVKSGQYRVNVCSSDVGSYGVDIQSSLPELLHAILMYDKRVRIEFLQDLNPDWVCYYKEKIIELAGEQRINGILMPVQSGSEKILKLMRRDLDLRKFKQCVADIRRQYPRIKLKTQVIVGFPTETEEDFQYTAGYLEECGFDQVDIFVYYEVDVAEARTLMPKVAHDVAQERMDRLLRLLPARTIKTIGM